MPIRTIATILCYATVFTIGLSSGATVMYKYCNVQKIKYENQQDKILISNLTDKNNQLQFALNLSESTNELVRSERDVITKEYHYANTIIANNKITIDKLNHITTNWVRLMDASGTNATMQQITSYASGTFSTNESSISATRVLIYVDGMKEDRNKCATQYNQLLTWYNTLRDRWNNGL